jgi:putative hydrolase of the HAD superfamily
MALLPGTAEMLEVLRSKYRLGLLSNFTHAPAVREALSRLKVDSYFDFILISGELGHRKPGAVVFSKLIEQFGMPKQQIAYVGDDPVADIQGALDAGIQPIWTHYAAIHTQRPFKELPEPVEPPIPIIENWDDLLALLNGEIQS